MVEKLQSVNYLSKNIRALEKELKLKGELKERSEQARKELNRLAAEDLATIESNTGIQKMESEVKKAINKGNADKARTLNNRYLGRINSYPAKKRNRPYSWAQAKKKQTHQKNKSSGTVSRKSGGKIMQGYKAGGKV